MPSVISKASNQVAIIGRPNVGKSTLFNILTRTRKAMVKNQPGVTRDVIIEKAHWWGRDFLVVDTGGLTDEKEGFSPLIKKQVLNTISDVELLLVVVDARIGLTPEDRDVVRLAQESGKPFILIANKVDQMRDADVMTSEFYEFGMQVYAASFERKEGVDSIIEWILENLNDREVPVREGLRLAIVGKPNAGKSSLYNRLLQKERVLVSSKAGTTVDSIEDSFEFNGESYILVDTAGLRRGAKRTEAVEQVSAIKSHHAIDSADMVILVIDGRVGPTAQDSRLIQYCLEQHKAIIVAANKLDLAREEIPAFREWFRQKLAREFHFFVDIPLVFISAKTGAGVDRLFAKVRELWGKLNIRITTSKLNDFFFEVIRMAPSPVYGTRNVKFYYATQTRQVPPSFILFANHPSGVNPSYRRFIVNKIKERWNLEGVPVRIFVMQSERHKKRKTLEASSDIAGFEGPVGAGESGL